MNRNNLLQFIINKTYRVNVLASHGLFNWMSDEKYIKMKYRLMIGKNLNLDSPKTFNEKLQWLKLHDRKDLYKIMVDKYEAKQYVGALIGNEHIVPTIGIYDSFDDIDFSLLPNQFVIKSTHDSGGLVICKDKDRLNTKEAKKKINRSLRRNFYYSGREWPYKELKHRIIVEDYLVDNESKELRDYKFFCFNGRVEYYKIDFNRFSKHQANYYDKQGRIQYFGEEICPPDFKKNLPIPYNLKEMIAFAEQLSRGISFVRIDFYEVNKRVYFGEITFYPAAGFGKFIPEEWDEKLGKLISLHVE